MIIVSAADEGFVPHYATMLHSGWFHNRQAEFCLLDCGITSDTRQRLERFAAEHAMRFTIVPIETEAFRDLPLTRDDLTAATFARLTLPDIFPDVSDRLIFLDADCVVTGDLSPLWETDICGYLIAGVQDDKALEADGADGILRDQSIYINAGVMLVNLQAWRDENFGEAVIDYLRGRRLRSNEQSAINIMAAGRIKLISELWNLMLHTMDGRRLGTIEPRVIHSTGMMKPWLVSDAPLGAIYRCHRNLTPFPLDRFLPNHRSRLRVALNLLALRRKYWRRIYIPPINDRDFTNPYVEKVSQAISAAERPVSEMEPG